MDKYKETFETWNKLAWLYQDKFMHLALYNHTYNFFCDSMAVTNSKILEIGCGPGNIAQYIIAKRPDFDLLGIDIAPNMIELAKKNNPTASFTLMDAREIGKLTTKFDGIVCGFCLPYLSPSDCDTFIKHAAQLLLPNGLLYISFVEGHPNKSHFQLSPAGYRSYFYFHLLATVKSHIKNNQLEEIKIFKVDYIKTQTEHEIHTILIARKN